MPCGFYEGDLPKPGGAEFERQPADCLACHAISGASFPFIVGLD